MFSCQINKQINHKGVPLTAIGYMATTNRRVEDMGLVGTLKLIGAGLTRSVVSHLGRLVSKSVW